MGLCKASVERDFCGIHEAMYVGDVPGLHAGRRPVSLVLGAGTT